MRSAAEQHFRAFREAQFLQIRLSNEQSVAAPVAEHVRKVEAEVDVLKQLQHANIVRYLVSRVLDRLRVCFGHVASGRYSDL